MNIKFVLQSQTIKIINVDNKVQTEKEVRKHKNDHYRFPYVILSVIYQTAAKQTC